MTLDDIKHLRELLAKTTPGAWRWKNWPQECYLVGDEFDDADDDCRFEQPGIVINSDLSCGEYCRAIEHDSPDAELIAALHNAAPELLRLAELALTGASLGTSPSQPDQ